MRNLENRNLQGFLEDEFAKNVNPILMNSISIIKPPLHIYAIMYESLLLEPFPAVW